MTVSVHNAAKEHYRIRTVQLREWCSLTEGLLYLNVCTHPFSIAAWSVQCLFEHGLVFLHTHMLIHRCPVGGVGHESCCHAHCGDFTPYKLIGGPFQIIHIFDEGREDAVYLNL